MRLSHEKPNRGEQDACDKCVICVRCDSSSDKEMQNLGVRTTKPTERALRQGTRDGRAESGDQFSQDVCHEDLMTTASSTRKSKEF